jgi:hypothetical protein
MRRPRITSLKKIFRFLMVIFGCLHLAGGPYALIQTCAWIGMIVTYSQKDGIAQGVRDTFSGEKPCHLCTKIATAKKDESKQPLSKDVDLSALSKLRTECLAQEIIRLKPPHHVEHQPQSILDRGVWMSRWLDAPVSPPPELA